jgi:hypothetical protein
MKLIDLATEVAHVMRVGHACELISPSGRGKSDFAHWLVEEMSRQDGEKWGKAELFLATQSPPDLTGYLFKGEVTYAGKTYSITDPTLPTWFICDDGQPVLAYKHGILIIDEYSKGQPDVKAAGAELFLHGRIGSHYLPDGWGRLALSNRVGDRSGDTKNHDFVINRRCEWHVTDDLRGTIDWWQDHNASRQVCAWAEKAVHEQHSVPLIFMPPPEKQGPWATPRSCFMADQYLQFKAKAQGLVDQLPTDPITVETVQGYIGVPAARSLFESLILDTQMPKYEDIVKDPLTVKVPERADQQMMVCYNLAYNVEEKHIKQIIQYVVRMDADFAVTFVRAMLKRKPMFASNSSFLEWAMKNGTLIAQISALNAMIK